MSSAITNKTVKEDIISMQKDIEHINSNIDDIKEYIKEDREWKEDFAKCLDTKYSAKWVETGMITLFFAVAGGTLLFLLDKL